MSEEKLTLRNCVGKTINHLTITGIDRVRMNNCKNTNSYVFADCDCGMKIRVII